MDPFGFFLGVAAFETAVKFKKPIRKAAVFTASRLMTIANDFKGTVYGLKEEFEDIIAEAHYENMKKSMAERGEPSQESTGQSGKDG